MSKKKRSKTYKDQCIKCQFSTSKDQFLQLEYKILKLFSFQRIFPSEWRNCRHFPFFLQTLFFNLNTTIYMPPPIQSQDPRLATLTPASSLWPFIMSPVKLSLSLCLYLPGHTEPPLSETPRDSTGQIQELYLVCISSQKLPNCPSLSLGILPWPNFSLVLQTLVALFLGVFFAQFVHADV